MPKNTLKLGIIGGGLDSTVGRAHHIAAQMDGRFRIVAGCFSQNSDSNIATARSLDVPESRAYGFWKEFLENERDKIDAVLLLTPTPLHAEMAIFALENKVPVISEKALCVSSDEAREIRSARDKNKGYVAIIYNYSAYPMVRELQGIIRDGRIGIPTHIAAEMPQEGFLRLVGIENKKPSPQSWRLRDNFVPMVSLDLGVHLHHLIYFLTDQTPLEVSAMEQKQGHFKEIVDNVQCLAQYTSELSVQMWYGKTALGYANGLRIRIFGTKGSAEWLQMNPENLLISDFYGNTTITSRSANTSKICNQDRYNRFKAGHPAGFIEALANYYYDLADSLEFYLKMKSPSLNRMIGGLDEAQNGLFLLEAIAKSAKQKVWVKVKNE